MAASMMVGNIVTRNVICANERIERYLLYFNGNHT